AFIDHEATEAHGPLVREPVAVPRDAVARLRLGQGGQSKGLERLLALRARARFRLRLGAVVLARLHDGVRARDLARLREIALLRQDVDLGLHDVLEGWVIAPEGRLHRCRRGYEKPAYARGLEREHAIELRQGPIVLTHTNRERCRAIDQL